MNYNLYGAWDEFGKFESNRSKSGDTYEISRQKFLKLLGQNRLSWTPTSEDLDMDVEVSGIYRRERYQYLAFMRIQPRGFRAQRVVPSGLEMVFHILMGRVNFTYRKRTRTLNRGNHITISPQSTYSIKCLTNDQPAYLIFRVFDRNKIPNSDQSSSTVVLEDE